VIRPAAAADAEALAALVRAAFAGAARRFGLTAENCPSHPSLTDAGAVLRSLERGTRFLLLETGGTLAGAVGLRPPRDGIAALEKLSVDPEFQGQGWGSRLLAAAAGLAAVDGAAALEASVIDGDEPLKAWYARRGFDQVAAARYDGLPFAVGVLRRPLA
jgi:GNAT superfamily N-acetyltransferase